MEMAVNVFLPKTRRIADLVFFVMQNYPSLIEESSTI